MSAIPGMGTPVLSRISLAARAERRGFRRSSFHCTEFHAIASVPPLIFNLVEEGTSMSVNTRSSTCRWRLGSVNRVRNNLTFFNWKREGLKGLDMEFDNFSRRFDRKGRPQIVYSQFKKVKSRGGGPGRNVVTVICSQTHRSHCCMLWSRLGTCPMILLL